MKEIIIPCRTGSAEAFAPYGQFVSSKTRAADADCEELKFWNKLGVMDVEGKTSVSVVQTYGKNGLTEYNLERHLCTEETIIPTDDIYVVAALDIPGDNEKPDMNSVQAFLVPKGCAVIFGKGVWHHAPITKQDLTNSFVIFKETTPDEDMLALDLAETYDLHFTIKE